MIYLNLQFSNYNHLNIKDIKILIIECIILFLKLDLDKPLENQGPFAVILHKLTEIIARNDEKVCLYLCYIFIFYKQFYFIFRQFKS